MTTNGAITTLTNAPGAAGTTFALATGTGAWFEAGPALVYNASATVLNKTSIEAVTLGAPSGDSITVVRAQEGHAALNLAAGAVLVQGITAKRWDDLGALVATKLGAPVDRGAWAATTAYAVGDVVTSSSIRYLCKTAHTSGGSFSGTNWVALGVDLSGTYAPLASPALTGTPTAPTAAQGTNTTQVATTAYVNAEIAADVPGIAAVRANNLSDLANAATARTNLGLGGAATLNVGTTAGTVAAGDDSRLAAAAPLASPTFTGDPKAPTAAYGDNDTSLATTAYVTAASLVFTPERYGAKGDWRQVADAAMTSGSATLTSATAAFTAGDVGKTVSVQGAGASGVDLITTISAFTNSTTVTLAATASTTVTAKYLDIATDDTAAIQSAIDAAAAAGGGVVQLAAKTYVVNAAPRTDRGARAILCLPQATVRTTMTIRGVLPAEHHDTQSKPVTAIKTLRITDTYGGNFAHPPSVLAAQGFWGVLLENIAIVVPKDPKICGVDFYDILRCEFRCVAVMPDWRGTEAVGSSTQPWTFGVRTKGAQNYDKILFTSLMICGFWTGLLTSCEHATGVDVVIHRCSQALALEPSTHAAIFYKLSVEWCSWVIAAWDPNFTQSGFGDLLTDNGSFSGTYPIIIHLLDLEQANGIKDPYNKLRGTVNFFNYSSGVRDASALSVTGGAGLKVTNLMGLGNGKIVPGDAALVSDARDGVVSGTTPPVIGTGASGFGNCLVFDGSGSGSLSTVCCVNLGLPATQKAAQWAPSGTAPFSLEARFKRTRTGVQEAIVAMWASAGAGNNNYILQIDSANKIQAVMRGAGVTNYIATGTTSIVDTNWHLAAFTFDGSNLRVFLDGVLEATVAGAVFQSPGPQLNPLIVGAYSDGSTPFIGSIDEVRLSTVARRTATYTAETAPFTADGQTAGLWHFNALL